MIKKTIWEILNIESTRDISLIKSAYAQQAKLVHPEDNPIGFQELREAYQVALRLASFQQPNNSDILIPASLSEPSVVPIKEKSEAQYKTEIDFDDVELDISADIDISSKIPAINNNKKIEFKVLLEEFIYAELNDNAWRRFIESSEFIRFTSKKKNMNHFLNSILAYKTQILLPQSVVDYLNTIKDESTGDFLLRQKIDKTINYILIAQKNNELDPTVYQKTKTEYIHIKQLKEKNRYSLKIFSVTILSIILFITPTMLFTLADPSISRVYEKNVSNIVFLFFVILIISSFFSIRLQKREKTSFFTRLLTGSNLLLISCIFFMLLSIFSIIYFLLNQSS